jgi:Response regulator containing CheY-like receiver, AAA-type ATPase, and DNA-binding domains
MRLLVVDDAPQMLKAFRDILESQGCEVFEAENGEDASIKYAELKPDIVLMDVLMPKLDGISATRKILKDDPNARIIVISAVGKSGLEKECLMAGAKEFIVKPFKIKELLNSIDRLARLTDE